MFELFSPSALSVGRVITRHSLLGASPAPDTSQTREPHNIDDKFRASACQSFPMVSLLNRETHDLDDRFHMSSGLGTFVCRSVVESSLIPIASLVVSASDIRPRPPSSAV